MSTVQHLTADLFDDAVKNKVSLIDFWAEWCGPCRAFSPVLEEIATELPDDILVAKVNIDKDPELAAKFHIMSIPAIFILQDGKPVKNFIGVQPKEKVLQAVLNA